MPRQCRHCKNVGIALHSDSMCLLLSDAILFIDDGLSVVKVVIGHETNVGMTWEVSRNFDVASGLHEAVCCDCFW